MFTHTVSANEIEILQTAHHRNGVSGAPFEVLLFTHEERQKLAILFQAEFHCAILDVATLTRGDIETSKWRGDAFEPTLRRSLKLQEQE